MGSRARGVRGLAVAGLVALVASGCGGGGTKKAAPAPSVNAKLYATASAAPTYPAESVPGPEPRSSTPDYSAGRSTPVADDVYPQYGDVAADVLHYGLDVRWNPTAADLSGTAALTIRAAKPTSRFVLDLAPGMTVDAMTVDGKATQPTRSGDHLTVPLAAPVPVDQVVTVAITYHGTPSLAPPPMTRRDITGLGAQVTASGGVWSQQEPYGAFTWYPCNDQPSDKALYDVSITAPDGWAGVTGGTFLGRSEQNGSGVYRWHEPSPVSTYLVAFAVDRFQETTATGPHGLPMTFWSTPDVTPEVKPLIAQAPAMLEFLEQHYGPYPFPTAGVVFVPGRAGMETQTMITLSPGLPPDALLHEFAHHWFGDAVTPTTWEGLWLNEGFAMYTQYLWDAQQQATPLDTVMQGLRAQDQQLRTQDGPPGHYLPTHFASMNVYLCPALMLNGLRHQLGGQEFSRMMTDWAQNHRYTNQDRASFTAFLKAETGRDFSAYVSAWLDSPTTPAS